MGTKNLVRKIGSKDEQGQYVNETNVGVSADDVIINLNSNGSHFTLQQLYENYINFLKTNDFIYYGTTQPVNSHIKMWIDTSRSNGLLKEGEEEVVTPTPLPEPNITESSNSYTQNSGEAVSFTIDRPIEEFDGVYVDDVELTVDDDYTLESGSTIVTFTDTYLESLEPGEYEVKFMFTEDRYAAQTFTVVEAAEDENNEEPDPVEPPSGDGEETYADLQVTPSNISYHLNSDEQIIFTTDSSVTSSMFSSINVGDNELTSEDYNLQDVDESVVITINNNFLNTLEASDNSYEVAIHFNRTNGSAICYLTILEQETTEESEPEESEEPVVHTLANQVEEWKPAIASAWQNQLAGNYDPEAGDAGFYNMASQCGIIVLNGQDYFADYEENATATLEWLNKVGDLGNGSQELYDEVMAFTLSSNQEESGTGDEPETPSTGNTEESETPETGSESESPSTENESDPVENSDPEQQEEGQE